MHRILFVAFRYQFLKMKMFSQNQSIDIDRSDFMGTVPILLSDFSSDNMQITCFNALVYFVMEMEDPVQEM